MRAAVLLLAGLWGQPSKATDIQYLASVGNPDIAQALADRIGNQIHDCFWSYQQWQVRTGNLPVAQSIDAAIADQIESRFAEIHVPILSDPDPAVKARYCSLRFHVAMVYKDVLAYRGVHELSADEMSQSLIPWATRFLDGFFMAGPLQPSLLKAPFGPYDFHAALTLKSFAAYDAPASLDLDALRPLAQAVGLTLLAPAGIDLKDLKQADKRLGVDLAVFQRRAGLLAQDIRFHYQASGDPALDAFIERAGSMAPAEKKANLDLLRDLIADGGFSRLIHVSGTVTSPYWATQHVLFLVSDDGQILSLAWTYGE